MPLMTALTGALLAMIPRAKARDPLAELEAENESLRTSLAGLRLDFISVID